MPSQLTNKQREVGHWICRFFEKHCQTPTIQQITSAFDWASTGAAHYHVDRLRDAGLLEPSSQRPTDQAYRIEEGA